MSTHRVRRLRWQARAPSPAGAFALRSLLRGHVDACEAALDRGFDGAGARDEVWHLPRLELKVEITDVQSLSARGLTERVEEAVRAALSHTPRTRVSMAAAHRERTDDPVADAARSAPAGSSRHSVTVEGRHALQHYLTSGLLPWTLAGLPPEQARHALREAAVEAAEAIASGGESLDGLLQGVGIDARVGALLRWLPLLPPALRRRWVGATNATPGLAVDAVDAWRTWIDGDAADRTEWQAVWLALWLAPRLAESLDLAYLRARIARQRPATAIEPPFVEALRNARGEGPGRSSREALDSGPESPTDARVATSPTVAPSPPASPVHREGTGSDSAAMHAAVRDARNLEGGPEISLLVPLAGVVLLHPWLARLLAACGVLDDAGKQVAPASLPRACALLHAMACGDEDIVEHQLPLVKLLLGRSPDEPLDTALPTLTPADREEIGALLGSVRDHWTALRGTGIDGLRAGFLQRRGLLTREDRVWKLRMQSESFDVLLGLLPWSIAVVRLPWMPDPLMVEWSTP